tara:strand:- start:121 stop:1224 length:1104 start_codon:yes stop_codon:yes gene_type:complete
MRKITLSDNDFQNATAFAYLMYKNGGLLYQSQTSREDSFLGYANRWFSKYFEKVVLEEYLPDNIELISDFFIYGSQVASMGIAPDIIGIKKNNKLVKFASLDSSGWKSESGMPQVEIKSFKSSNEIWTLGDTQLLDYFIAITYEVNQDYYLRQLIDHVKFDWSIYNLDIFIDEFENNTNFIKKFDTLKKTPSSEPWGTVEIEKILSRSDVTKYFRLMGSKQSPWYLSENLEDVLTTVDKIHHSAKKLSNPAVIEIIKGKTFFDVHELNNMEINEFYKDDIRLPTSIICSESVTITILAITKSTTYLKVDGKLEISNILIEDNNSQTWKLKYKKFDRSSTGSEYCLHKSVSSLIPDSENEFINKLIEI